MGIDNLSYSLYAIVGIITGRSRGGIRGGPSISPPDRAREPLTPWVYIHEDAAVLNVRNETSA